jgi:hypothetical protein
MSGNSESGDYIKNDEIDKLSGDNHVQEVQEVQELQRVTLSHLTNWPCSTLWALASSTNSLQVSLSIAGILSF